MLGIGPRSIVSRPPLWLLLSGSAAAQEVVLNGAQTLLDGETQGLAFDFTDQSAYIVDTGTPANNYNSSGIVSSGSLVGPSGKLTYTSPSNKLTRQSDGFIKYQAHNLCAYSEEIDNGAWGKNGTPTITANADGVAELWTPAASSAQHWIREPVYTSVAGVTYVFSVRVKPNGYTNLQLFAGSTEAGTTAYCNFVLSGSGSKGTEGATATGSISAVGDGYYNLQLQFTATGSTATASFYLCAISSSTSVRNETWAPDGASGYYVTRAHHYRFPANTDYIKTTSAAVYALPLEYDTSGSCLGLLVEEQRTNLCLHSTDFSDSTAHNTNEILPFGSGSTVNAGVSPDGRTNADFVVPSTASAAHWTSLAVASVTSGSTYTASVYVKAGGYNFVQITPSTGFPTTAYANFNIATGALGNSNAVTGTIKDCGSGWYRISIAVAANASSAGRFILAVLNADTASRLPSYAGDGVSGVYFYQGQFEVGSFPTSPIVTYGAAATRNADNISIATSAFPYSLSAQSVYIEAKRSRRDEGGRLLLLEDGTNYLMIQDNAANLVTEVRETSAGVTFGGNHGDHSIVAPFKVALAAEANNASSCMDGGSIQTDVASVTMPTSLTRLTIGSAFTFSWFNGYVRAVSAVPRRKTDAELQAETT